MAKGRAASSIIPQCFAFGKSFLQKKSKKGKRASFLCIDSFPFGGMI